MTNTRFHTILKIGLIAILFQFNIAKTLAQVTASEVIQDSKTAKQTAYPLFFVDFWATWCGPCVYASEYISVLQRQYPDMFYVISLSEENPDIIKKFISKRPTDLAVLVDYEGQTFKNYSVKALPHGILLNANGNVLWQGNPSDFKAHMLERFYSRNKNTVEINNFFNLKTISKTNEKAVYKPTSDFEILPLTSNTVSFQAVQQGNYLEITGMLQDILAYVIKVNSSQIKLENNLNKPFKLYIDTQKNNANNIPPLIYKALNLNEETLKHTGEALVLEVSNINFWDTNQIDWGTDHDRLRVLIDDNDIQADNMTLNDLTYYLSSLIQMPVIIKGSNTSSLQHDWQVHYKFFDLMQSNLLDVYGIVAEKNTIDYTVYNITKKTL